MTTPEPRRAEPDPVVRTGPVLDAQRAADYCGIARRTLWNLLSTGQGPVSFKHGSKLAFYPDDLDAWLATRLKPTTRRQQP